MPSPHLPYWLAALHLPGVGPRTMMRWLSYFADIEKLFTATHAEWQAAGIPSQHRRALQQPNWHAVEQDLNWQKAQSTHYLIAFDDEYYPALLKEITDAPLLLYVEGSPTILAYPQIAIVGSRQATAAGINNAEQFAYCLAASGLVITSGLALGIDGASHRGALAAKGLTIGVAGTGLQHSYPLAHRSLVAEIIAKNGAVISEFPLATPPKAQNFPRRNRLIAGLSTGVVVIEAALKSGSLITARHAVEQGREVFAIPGSIHQPQARGCHYLIREGAKLVETAADILEELGAFRAIMKPTKPALAPSKTELSAATTELLACIYYEITPLDVILLRSRLTASEVSSMLLTLELNGYIQSVAGGYIRVRLD